MRRSRRSAEAHEVEHVRRPDCRRSRSSRASAGRARRWRPGRWSRTLACWATTRFSSTVKLRTRPDLLERATEAALGPRLGLEVGDVLAEQADPARGRRVEARHAVEQRGLAGAVGAEDPDDLALVDRAETRRLSACTPPKRMDTESVSRTGMRQVTDGHPCLLPAPGRVASGSRLEGPAAQPAQSAPCCWAMPPGNMRQREQQEQRADGGLPGGRELA